ncbi:MAG: hypothetical protein IJX53_05085 [Clostridia bacterium]|nr:hypothetical protein [Clostridia bacterium]
MDIGIGYERLTAAAGGVRAEAVFLRLEGEGRGIERINAFYRRAAETWLARCTGEGALPGRLPEGRYTARLCAAAELEGDVLAVTLSWRLCRRGRPLEETQCLHRWQLPRGYLLPQAKASLQGNEQNLKVIKV